MFDFSHFCTKLGGFISQYILGVDPGLTGGMAVIDPLNNDVVAVTLMPKIKRNTRSEIDPYKVSKFINDNRPYFIKFAIIEDVSSMPGQGVVSMFTFGKVQGIVIGALAAVNLPILFVKPFIWKMAFGLSKDKSLSFSKASELYPLQKEMWNLKKHEGIAEAVLIAKYGERFF